MASYINRYVAFLDILGFQDLISRSVGEAPTVTIDEIRSILEVSEPAGEMQVVLGRIGDISKSDHRVTAFSDSIIISVAETEQGLIHLLHHIGKIGYYLARLGVLYRGGVSNGLTYHDELQVFGPAVIEAYKIEQQAACPRVLLSAAVVNAGRAAAKPVSTIFDGLTRKDCDGGIFVDYLRVLRLIADSDGPVPDDVKTLHQDMKRTIEQQLERFSIGTAERTKWEWFSTYFNWAIDESWRELGHTPFPS